MVYGWWDYVWFVSSVSFCIFQIPYNDINYFYNQNFYNQNFAFFKFIISRKLLSITIIHGGKLQQII